MFELLCYTRCLKECHTSIWKKYFGFTVNKISKILLHKGIHQLQDAIGSIVKTLSCNATLFRLLLPNQKPLAYYLQQTDGAQYI